MNDSSPLAEVSAETAPHEPNQYQPHSANIVPCHCIRKAGTEDGELVEKSSSIPDGIFSMFRIVYILIASYIPDLVV